jgi:hypothetical protein
MGRLLSIAAMAFVAFVATSTLLADRHRAEALSSRPPALPRRAAVAVSASRLAAHPGHPFPAYYGTPRPEDDADDDMRYQFGRAVGTSTAMTSSARAAVQERPPEAPSINANANTNQPPSNRRVSETNNFYEEYLRERQRRHIPAGVGAGAVSGNGAGMAAAAPSPPPPPLQPLSRTATPDYAKGLDGGGTGIFAPPAPGTAAAPVAPSPTAVGRRPDFSPYRSNIQRPSLAPPATSSQRSGPESNIDAANTAGRDLILSKLDALAKQQHDWNDRMTKVEIKVDRQAQDHEARTRRLLEEFRLKNEQTTQSFLKTVTKDIQGMQTTLNSVVNDQKQLQEQQATTAKRMTELETSQIKKITDLESKHDAELIKLKEEQSKSLQEVQEDMTKKHQQETEAVKLALQEDQKAQADRLVAFEKAQVERLAAFEEIQQERTQEQLERAIVDMMQQQQQEHEQMMMMDMEMEQQDRRRMQGPPLPSRMGQDPRRGPSPPLPHIQREPDGPPPKKGMLRDRLMQKGDQEQLYQSPNKKKGSGASDESTPPGMDKEEMDYRMRMEEQEHPMMRDDEERRLDEQAWRKDPLIPPPPQGPRPSKKGGQNTRPGINGPPPRPPGRYSNDDDEEAMMMRRQRMMMIDGEEDAMDFGPPLPPRGAPAAMDDLLIVDEDIVDNMIGQALNNYRPFQGDDLLAKNPFGHEGPVQVPKAGKDATGGGSFGRHYDNANTKKEVGLHSSSAREVDAQKVRSGMIDSRRDGEPVAGSKSPASSSSDGGGFHRRYDVSGSSGGAVDAGSSSKGGVMGDPSSMERALDKNKERAGILGRNQLGRNAFAPVPPPPSSATNRNGPSIDDRLEHFLRETKKSGQQDHFNKEMECLLLDKYRPMYEWLTPNNAVYLRNVLVTFMEHKGCQVEMDLKNATEQAAYEWEELLNILAFELYRLTGHEPRIVSEGSNKWGIYDETGHSIPNGQRRERNNFAVSRQP